MILTSLTTNAHMRERGALAEASGQSHGQAKRFNMIH